MKRKTAKEILVESFRELAESRSVDKITIKEITDNCGYSTATFYRQFKDKYDLIAWNYTRDFSEIVQRDDHNNEVWRKTLLESALFFQNEKKLLTNLLLHTSGHDSFIQYMTDINCLELTAYLLKASGRDSLDQKTEMYVRLYCMGTVGLTCEWILGKYAASPEELAELYENSLPNPLKKMLQNK